jgi:hypothetical protein
MRRQVGLLCSHGGRGDAPELLAPVLISCCLCVVLGQVLFPKNYSLRRRAKKNEGRSVESARTSKPAFPMRMRANPSRPLPLLMSAMASHFVNRGSLPLGSYTNLHLSKLGLNYPNLLTKSAEASTGARQVQWTGLSVTSF